MGRGCKREREKGSGGGVRGGEGVREREGGAEGE